MNAIAEQEGLRSGQSLADARSLVASLVTEPADPKQAEQFLATLARWSERFTPLVGTDGPKSGSMSEAETGANRQDALVLDISGIAHLFGGEERMLTQVMQAFHRFGLTVRACITETKVAARALCIYQAPHQTGPQIIQPGQIFNAIKNLSVQALEPSAAASKQLAHLGLLTLEQIVNLPSAGLARRFGLDLTKRLNQMLGHDADPIKPIAMTRAHSVRLRFPEPLGQQDDLVAASERVITHLLQRVTQLGQGLLQLRLILTSPNGETQTIHLGFATACQDLTVVMRLLEPKLDLVQSEFGFDDVRAQAMQTRACHLEQTSLLSDDKSQQDNALSLLFSQLGNRIGFDRICQFTPVATHLPEHRFTLRSVFAGKQKNAAGTPDQKSRKRPLSCFDPEPLSRDQVTNCQHPPEAFTWRRRPCQVRKAIGPERITPPWWQRVDGWEKGARDYWQVQTNEGDWLWLFTCPQNHKQASWFVSGRFH